MAAASASRSSQKGGGVMVEEQWASYFRSLRAYLGYTQEDVAARCGVDPAIISRIETGKDRITVDRMTSMLDAMRDGIDPLRDHCVVSAHVLSVASHSISSHGKRSENR